MFVYLIDLPIYIVINNYLTNTIRQYFVIETKDAGIMSIANTKAGALWVTYTVSNSGQPAQLSFGSHRLTLESRLDLSREISRNPERDIITHSPSISKREGGEFKSIH